jgi:hypothetical protein
MNWRIVMLEEPGVVSPQLRSFSPDIFSWTFQHLRDNTSDSLFARDIRIRDAQQSRFKKTVNMTFTFDLTHRALFGLGEYFQSIFVSTSYP